MARSLVLLCALVLLLLLLTPFATARTLRGDYDGRRLYEERFRPTKRSMRSGDDSVPTAANMADYQSKYNEWVHFQAAQLTTDYAPTAANPSVPCC